MSHTVYALLVGIDEYAGAPLNGCVNDAESVHEFLKGRLADDEFRLDARVLFNEQATRAAIIDGFRTHLTQAVEGDVALFFYAGHGSQEPAPKEFWHSEPDRLNETLVCHDSRTAGGSDLADKELAQLIHAVSSRNPHMVVILDCCHSGSATRDFDDEGVRRAPSDDRKRDLGSYKMDPETDALTVRDGKAYVQMGKYITLSACQDSETAKEFQVDGSPRGAFTYALVEALKLHGHGLTYRDLFKRVTALVRVRARAQTPRIETFEVEQDQPFLGGAVAAVPHYFTASRDSSGEWSIDGGSVHGVPAPQGEETTHLALFPIGAEPSDMSSRRGSVGDARVTKSLPDRSVIQLDFEPEPDSTYKAVITATPLPPVSVRLSGAADAVGRLRSALDTSLLVAASTDATGDEAIVVEATDSGFRIRRSNESRPVAVPVDGTDETAARIAVETLDHIARWMRIVELDNPATALLPGAIRMELMDADGKLLDPSDGQVHLHYRHKASEWTAPQFKLRLTNTSDRRLYCALVGLTEDFGVFTEFFPGSGEWLDGGAETWARLRRDDNTFQELIPAFIPDDLRRAGWTEVCDLIKLIVSTEECDASLLHQRTLRLDSSAMRSTDRESGPSNSLNRLMQRVNTRGFGLQQAKEEPIPDWTTESLGVVTHRPRDSQPLRAGPAAAPIQLGAGIEVLPHSALTADMRLASVDGSSGGGLDSSPGGATDRSTAHSASRSASRAQIPALFRNNPQIFQPLRSTASRSTEAGLSAIELLSVSGHSQVTAENPLRLRVAGELKEGEYVLPVAQEDGVFIPLGFGQSLDGESKFEVTIDTLPEPDAETEERTRSLRGSIRIYLEKVVVKALGQNFRYPLLAAVDPRPEGLERTQETEAVRARVFAAERIVLFVHGIIGDTDGMAEAAFAPPVGVSPLAEGYDLVLTYDYENLNTPIEANALSLKERLESIGLGPDHGKTLHVVAHSMGGLVSRWFIEQLGGHRVVERLVMLGTPNGGVPWPNLKNWATAGLAMGLNAVTAVAWPARAVAALVALASKVDVSLDQMAPDSAIVKTLAASPDSDVAYRIVAGNTGIIEKPDISGDESLLARLIHHLMPAAQRGASLAFFGAPNDMAVAVESIKSVPAGSASAMEVACDHMTYFSTADGQAALARALE